MDTTVPQTTKFCPACEKDLSRQSFYKDRQRHDGLLYICKNCIQSHKLKAKEALPPGHKRCSKCKSIEPLSNFYASNNTKAGYASHCKLCCYHYDKLKSKVKKKHVHLSCMYGLTLEEYNYMLQEQGGACAVCRQEETVIRHGKVLGLSVDHCHVTGAVRGLLCQRCNKALGFLGEDPERIEALLRYTIDRVLY